MSDGHNQCMPTFELKDIDYCMSKGRVSKKRTEKVLKNKNDEIEKLKERLKEAESILKNIQDEHELDFTHIREYQEKYQKG
jgi:hypothetical protein